MIRDTTVNGPSAHTRWLEAYEQIGLAQGLALLLMHAPPQVNQLPIIWSVSNQEGADRLPTLQGQIYRTSGTAIEEIEMIMEEWASYLGVKIRRQDCSGHSKKVAYRLDCTKIITEIQPTVQVTIHALVYKSQIS